MRQSPFEKPRFPACWRQHSTTDVAGWVDPGRRFSRASGYSGASSQFNGLIRLGWTRGGSPGIFG